MPRTTTSNDGSRFEGRDDDLHQFRVGEAERKVVPRAGRLGTNGHRQRAAPLAEPQCRVGAREAHVVDAARLGDLAVHAGMKGRPGGWENELLVAYLMPTGHVAAYSVPLVGGAFLWGGKVYR